jgi:hypothetical protein
MSTDRRPGGSGARWRGAELIGIVLIALGIVYLLGNLGIFLISWGVIWAVALIVVGAAILYGAVRPARQGSSGATVPREGSTRLELDLGVGAGRFRLAGGASQLVEVASTNDDIATRVERAGDRALVRLRQDVAWWPFAWRGGSDWVVRVARDVPTVLTMSAGAGDFSIDLSEMTVADVRLQIGAAQARIVLPRPRGTVEVRVSGGASQIAFEAPPGVEYRLETSGGMMSVNGRTESPGFAAATDRVMVRFSGGAASVRIG